MNSERLHGATSLDGTAIVGRVHGHGAPLVFVHGVTGDGDVDWDPPLPLVAPRLSCYLLSTRGRSTPASATTPPQPLPSPRVATTGGASPATGAGGVNAAPVRGSGRPAAQAASTARR